MPHNHMEVRGQLTEFVLSFYLLASVNQTQLTRLGGPTPCFRDMFSYRVTSSQGWEDGKIQI